MRKIRGYKVLDFIEILREMDDVTGKMYEILSERFSDSRECSGCGFCDGFTENIVTVPDWVRKEAGINEDAKLMYAVDSQTKTIHLQELEAKNDLSDVPEDLRQRLGDLGICLGALNESIMDEEVIYEE